MAMLVVDQSSQPTFKHFCRICKKGFMCGRALGGHMRAHGIGDDQSNDGHIDDEDQHSSDREDKSNGNAPSNKRMYALRTNPNRLKSCKICGNCGKEFTSWKSFLEHGKCRAEDVDYSLVSSPRSRDDQDEARRRECGWFKGKRTKRASVGNLNLNCPSNEEEDLANCLVMLSGARVDPVVEEESSCASASREEDRSYSIFPITNNGDKAKGVAKGMFECKACKKSFSSHQALGGHRASHKKVKGCFAAKLDDFDDSLNDEDVIKNDEFSMRSTSTAVVPFERSVDLQLATPSKRKSKVHECSVCHRIFSSGQALGGHKRCHWITSNSSDMSTIAKFHHFNDQSQFLQTPTFSKSDALDLNLPASTNDKNQDPCKDPLSLEISTEICLQSWGGVYMNDETKSNNDQNNNTTTTTTTTHHFNPSVPNVDEEVESRAKLAKLNDLKDLHMSGDSSPWLQVGIGTTSNMASDP